MTAWVPEAPDGHEWVPASSDCPDCSCCTARLCREAKNRAMPCGALVDGGPSVGVMDVKDCPCATLPIPAGAR